MFENEKFLKFYETNRVDHNFSTLKLHKKRVVQMNSSNPKEMDKTMMIARNYAKNLWVEVFSTSCYIINWS